MESAYGRKAVDEKHGVRRSHRLPSESTRKYDRDRHLPIFKPADNNRLRTREYVVAVCEHNNEGHQTWTGVKPAIEPCVLYLYPLAWLVLEDLPLPLAFPFSSCDPGSRQVFVTVVSLLHCTALTRSAVARLP